MIDTRLLFNFNLQRKLEKGMNLIISWWSYPAVTVLGKEKIQTVCLHDRLLKIWK